MSAEICGNSLCEAGIYEGDLAVIELTNEATNGDLVAILTPEGMQAKFYYQEKNGDIRLESRNCLYETKIYCPSAVCVQGVVREINRQLK